MMTRERERGHREERFAAASQAAQLRNLKIPISLLFSSPRPHLHYRALLLKQQQEPSSAQSGCLRPVLSLGFLSEREQTCRDLRLQNKAHVNDPRGFYITCLVPVTNHSTNFNFDFITHIAVCREKPFPATWPSACHPPWRGRWRWSRRTSRRSSGLSGLKPTLGRTCSSR